MNRCLSLRQRNKTFFRQEELNSQNYIVEKKITVIYKLFIGDL